MTSSEDLELMAYNKTIIDEFRANDGVVGGAFEGLPLLLITTKGAKSGEDRVSPLSYINDDARLVIAATNVGRGKHPGWYYNLLANPDLTVEIGTDTYEATAAEVDGEERDRLWAGLVASNRRLDRYKSMTTREIPVLVVERKSG
ncbi:nitroreductase family deazaflavin-dependent oxidoreductase [Nonomuraea sp. NPDC005983]|uniref:nitroreductase family deazaflavin-dependent oxidoreductase n=1 Tax=Nonomuraea sp. NPDC005983 TaxID=3155595 RepID=UPI0033A4068F